MPSKEITLDQLRALRMRSQGLAPRLPRESLVSVVKTLCGVQAQLHSAMELALRARVSGLTAGDIERSRVEDRALVRTWCMRGSMHLLAADDLDWQLATIPPAVLDAAWRWFERRNDFGPEIAAKISEEAVRVLKKNGPMPRRDLMEAVANRYGLEVIPAAAGVVHVNGLLGRVCFGPDQGATPTYTALDDWLGRSITLSEEADIIQLARRYLRGYGPAAPDDLAAWWGGPLGEARKAWAALEGELIEINCEGRSVWMLESQDAEAGQSKEPIVRLLPAFDQYLLGYDNRDFAVAPEYQERVFHGGQLVPVVLVNGSAAGTWRYEKQSKRFEITVAAFDRFTPEFKDLIEAEANDIGRFYDLTAVYSFTQEA